MWYLKATRGSVAVQAHYVRSQLGVCLAYRLLNSDWTEAMRHNCAHMLGLGRDNLVAGARGHTRSVVFEVAPGHGRRS